VGLLVVRVQELDSSGGTVGGACAGAGQQRRDCCLLQGKWAVELCHLFTYSAVRFVAFVVETRWNYSCLSYGSVSCQVYELYTSCKVACEQDNRLLS